MGQACNAASIGLNAIRLGKVELGFEWLERAVNTPEYTVTYLLPWTRDFLEFQNNPRFQTLLKKINLDDESINQLKGKGPF